MVFTLSCLTKAYNYSETDITLLLTIILSPCFIKIIIPLRADANAAGTLTTTEVRDNLIVWHGLLCFRRKVKSGKDRKLQYLIARCRV